MKTQIISTVQKKGGSAKTTNNIAMATRMINDGAKIAFIDTDESMNLYKWCKKEKMEFDYQLVRDKDLIKPTIKAMSKKGYDAIFIDTGGYESPISIYTIANSDLVFIPCKPDESSVRDAVSTYKTTVSVCDNFEKVIPTFVIMSDIDIRTNIAQKCIKAIKSRDIPMLKSHFGSSVGFKSMMTIGKEPKDKTSKKYLDSVMCELQMNKLITYYNEVNLAKRVA